MQPVVQPQPAVQPVASCIRDLTLTAKNLAAELDRNRDAQLDNFDIIKDQINLPELFVHFSFEISFSFNFSFSFSY